MKPGLPELLELLREAGIPAAVATGSSRAHAMENLERTKVLEFFQFVIAGDMVKQAKPDPEIYRITCEKLKLRPEETLVLEDSWNGVRAAYAAGAPVILVPDLQKDSAPVDGMYYKKWNRCWRWRTGCKRGFQAEQRIGSGRRKEPGIKRQHCPATGEADGSAGCQYGKKDRRQKRWD